MTKKEIRELDNEELIVTFAFAIDTLGRGYKIYKCDKKHYENVTAEMVERGMLSQDSAENIYKRITL